MGIINKNDGSINLVYNWDSSRDKPVLQRGVAGLCDRVLPPGHVRSQWIRKGP